MRRAALTGMTAIGLAVVLSGCVTVPSPFDGERDAADTLPDAVTPYTGGAIPDTSRYQGESDGFSLYLLKGTDPSSVCLAYTDGTKERSGMSCGGGGWLETQVPGGAHFLIRPGGLDDDPGIGETDVSRYVRRLA